MKKIVIAAFLISSLFSCKDSNEEKTKKPVSVVNNSIVKDSVKEEVQDDEVFLTDNFKNEFDILLPRSYRSYQGKNTATSLTTDWIDLYENQGEYYLAKADFKIDKGYDECVGDSLKSIIPKNKTLIFMDSPELKLGKIESLKIKKNKIWPKEKVTFVFNNVNYILRAEGKILSSEKRSDDNGKEEIFMNVKNYKLYLTVGNTQEILLLEQQSFNDTFVELLFAGDIDGDEKLDFIFSANRDYEEERVILFLSTKSQNGEEIKKVSEISVQFDC